MLILGVDTSGKNGSIALVRCEPGSLTTLDLVPLEGGTFSAQLVPQISALLQKHGLTKQQIDAFAVVSGPGSFTGLRVGLAAIKALSQILQKPIVSISLLEAIALAAGEKGRVTAAIDAGRGEVYLGTYDIREGRVTVLAESVLTAAEAVRETAEQHVVTQDKKLAEAVRGNRNIVDWLVSEPKADMIARLGFQKIQSGETVTPEALDASYIRRSDAEIKLSTTRG